MAPMTIRIRPATPVDAACLTHLAATTFRETFARDNTPEDMASYVAQAFTPGRQAAEIGDPDGAVLLAEHRSDGGAAELLGYAHVVAGPPPGAVRGPAPVELKRLYVARAWHGQGVADALMEAALDAARARGARTVWLGVRGETRSGGVRVAAVMPGSPALAAGLSVGDVVRRVDGRVGEHTFVLGADAQTDWLLARTLDDPPSSGPGPDT